MGERPGPPAPRASRFPFPPITSIAAAFAAAPNPAAFFRAVPPAADAEPPATGEPNAPNAAGVDGESTVKARIFSPTLASVGVVAFSCFAPEPRPRPKPLAAGVPSEAEDARFLARARSADDADDGGRETYS